MDSWVILADYRNHRGGFWWHTLGPRPTRDLLHLTQRHWLFECGRGSHTIASPERMGTLLVVHLFLDKPPSGKFERGTRVCSGATDNQSNSYAVKRYMTTKQPLAAVLMQLATELSSRRMWLDLRWTPRELNTEADNITNEI